MKKEFKRILVLLALLTALLILGLFVGCCNAESEGEATFSGELTVNGQVGEVVLDEVLELKVSSGTIIGGGMTSETIYNKPTIEDTTVWVDIDNSRYKRYKIRAIPHNKTGGLVSVKWYFPKEKPSLEEQYLKYCKTDSVVVGYKYITDEGEPFDNSKNTRLGESWYEAYNPKYRFMLLDVDYIRYATSMDRPDEDGYWGFICREDEENFLRHEEPYGYNRPHGYGLKYLRCDEIKLPRKPTFEGFYEWKQKHNK